MPVVDKKVAFDVVSEKAALEQLGLHPSQLSSERSLRLPSFTEFDQTNRVMMMNVTMQQHGIKLSIAAPDVRAHGYTDGIDPADYTLPDLALLSCRKVLYTNKNNRETLKLSDFVDSPDPSRKPEITASHHEDYYPFIGQKILELPTVDPKQILQIIHSNWPFDTVEISKSGAMYDSNKLHTCILRAISTKGEEFMGIQPGPDRDAIYAKAAYLLCQLSLPDTGVGKSRTWRFKQIIPVNVGDNDLSFPSLHSLPYLLLGFSDYLLEFTNPPDGYGIDINNYQSGVLQFKSNLDRMLEIYEINSSPQEFQKVKTDIDNIMRELILPILDRVRNNPGSIDSRTHRQEPYPADFSTALQQWLKNEGQYTGTTAQHNLAHRYIETIHNAHTGNV